MLLPNNKNIVPTAARVGELVEAKTCVVPTTSMAAGLTVMVGYDGPGRARRGDRGDARDLDSLRVAELTRSVRDARVGEREVPKGLT